MTEEIIIYQDEKGNTNIDVRLENETIWLTQKQMAELFERDVRTINEHIINVYDEGELDETSTIRKFRIVQTEGKRSVNRELDHYNLDMIIAVGYRVKSKIATRFRIWATNILKQYLIEGYAINQNLIQAKNKQLDKLQKAISVLSRSIENQAQSLGDAQKLTNIIKDFSEGLSLLDDFDNKTLDTKGKTTKEAVVIEKEEFLEIIDKMKPEFGSDVFANPKDDSFESSVRQIYQTFDGKECYPSIEEKAATLLYLVVKNHSFTDGNKRIGASCFLYFLEKNNALYKNGVAVIDNSTLATLTLLIAESKASEMETMKQVVLSVLNRG